jgi:hypothetical protein
MSGFATAIALALAAAVLVRIPLEAAFPGDKGRIVFSRDGDLYSMLPMAPTCVMSRLLRTTIAGRAGHRTALTSPSFATTICTCCAG